MGKCYLLLGAIYEKKENGRLAEENYSRAIVEHDIKDLDWINFEDLPLLKKMVNKINNEKQFERAKTDYQKGQNVNAKSRTERTISIITEDPSGQEDILGKCYLLLGAIYEKEGNTFVAEENYRKAKEYGTEYIAGVDFKKLSIYKRIMREGIILKPGEKKKKKFPLLLVVAFGVGVVIAIFLIPPKKKTLTVTRGEGVDGTPESGTTSHYETNSVDYSYTAKSGYTNLVVQMDGETVSASGTIPMNSNHTLTASASPIGPTVTITYPSNGKTVSGRIDINVDVQSAINIDRVELYVDNNRIDSDRDAPYSFRWNTRNVDDGYRTISRVVAYDLENNTGEDQISVYVNNEGGGCSISVAITDPSNDETVNGTVKIQAEVSGTCEIDRVEFIIDQKLEGTDSSAPYTYDWDTTILLDGPHPIQVVAYATTGETADAEIEVIVNNLGGNN